MALPRVHVHLDHGRDLESWGAAFAAGRVSEPTPYSYTRAGAWVDLTFSHDAAEGRLTRFLRRGAAFVLGMDLLHAWRNREALGAAEVIWTHTEHEHLAVGLLMRLRIVPVRPVVAQTVWLWDDWDDRRRLTRGLLRWIMPRQGIHSTHSRENLAVAVREAPTDAVLVPFGVTLLEPLPDRDHLAEGLRVVAPGNDRSRDWHLLREVAIAAPDVQILILSRRRAARRAASSGPSNLAVRAARTVEEYRALLRDADVVAVPTKFNRHASGMTTILEACVLRRPVVTCDTGGMRHLLGPHAQLARPGDPSDFLTAIRNAARLSEQSLDATRAAVVERGLTLEDFARRHVLLTRRVLGLPHDAAAISALRPVELPEPPLSTRPD